MKRTAVVMGVALAASAALAVASVVAAISAPSRTELAGLFGAQLDCSTQRAASFAGENPVDAGDIMKAVDKCMSAVSTVHGAMMPGYGEMAILPLKDADQRREALADAVHERVTLCTNLGIPPQRFAATCPQIFALERLAGN